MGIVTNYIDPSKLEDTSALHKFNWGAFFYEWLWGLGNGAFRKTWYGLLIQAVFMVAFFFLAPAMASIVTGDYGALIGVGIFMVILGLIYLGLKVYYGLNGNKWACEGRAFYNVADFEETQKNWAIAAAATMGVCLVSTIIVVMLQAAALAMVFGSLGGATGGASSSATKMVIQDIIDGEKTHGKFASGPDAVDYLIENSSFVKMYDGVYKASKYSANSFKMVMPDLPDTIFYLFLVKKTSDCDLSKQNCYVIKYRTHSVGERPAVDEKIYFDNNGKTKVAKRK